ncbi:MULTISPECIES: FMN-binding negative transcriptional regulator [unclassified Mammaliicoccus]|uniref:FMN-binding negative transcriptional regulator n=1 Tax=unclassified Mammaliicoccus TaxID=2803851 RepID=UPI001EFAF039|nr:MULTISPECIES: FMN-binding negative transcriptional regulator [unclassified Mammaliicoccus]
MYIPKHYQMKDYQEIKNFMTKYNFATVVTVDELKPIATHLPVIINEHDDALFISGHFARGNKQWRTMDNNEDVLIIFHGPHGYISSTWYETEDVPTWDYQSIHVYGKSVLLNEHQLKEDLKVLLDKYESEHRGGATWENLSDQTKKQIKGIVGFKVKVDKLEAAYKLSQNRSETDKENIVIHLNNTESELDKNLAEEIEKY